MKYSFAIIVTAFVGCKSTSNGTSESSKNDVKNNTNNYSANPVAIIYKTKADYYDKVPITLSDDKTKIIFYPAPGDVFYKGVLALPSKLTDGYLLDNRGVYKNAVFLNVTYDAYSKLKEAPSLDEMMKMIIDKNPFTEMYNCGNRYQYKDIVNDLNKIITEKQLNKFKKIL